MSERGDTDRMANPYPPSVGQFTDYQLPARQQWTLLDEEGAANHAAQIVHIVPSGSSTVTVINPLDNDPEGYRVRPWPSYTRPRPAGRV